MDEELIYRVLAITEEIPYGSVATYGQIANLAGRPRNARLVGRIMSMADMYGDFPCHRVVNHSGRVAPYFTEQKSLLEAEGVAFKDEKHVNLSKFQWRPEQ